MNRSILTVGVCALVSSFALSGCGKEETAPAGAKDAASSALDATKDAAKDLSKQAGQAWEKAKTSLMSEGEGAISSIESSIETLKAKGAQIPEETKAAYDTTMKELSTQFESVKAEFAKLKDSAEGSWDKVSADFQKSLANMKEAINEAMKQFGSGA